MTDPFIVVMAKHLPPSGARLRLLDVAGAAGSVLSTLRGDLDPLPVSADGTWSFPPDSADAVVARDVLLSDDLLSAALAALRPGGRLIIVDAERAPSGALVELLEAAGYTRILVEPALEGGEGVLLRGEKPHTAANTLERIESVARADAGAGDFAAYTGRYVHLLIRVTPNKPAWALREGETQHWDAVGLLGEPPTLLAFSSLPKAVEFMQPAVLSGAIRDVNKVGKFSRATAAGWSVGVLLNPSLEALEGHTIALLPIDPGTAETPDE
jgi:SAM-dependent methyltransferase